jgi:hypothetical protein
MRLPVVRGENKMRALCVMREVRFHRSRVCGATYKLRSQRVTRKSKARTDFITWREPHTVKAPVDAQTRAKRLVCD